MISIHAFRSLNETAIKEYVIYSFVHLLHCFFFFFKSCFHQLMFFDVIFIDKNDTDCDVEHKKVEISGWLECVRERNRVRGKGN